MYVCILQICVLQYGFCGVFTGLTSSISHMHYSMMSDHTPSKLLVRMSPICAIWAILCKEYLEPNLSIFEMHWLEMKVFL